MKLLDKLPGDSYEPHPDLVRALDVVFILHADHELNCSTAAVRHVGSAGTDPFCAVAAGCAALYGPLHGGANEAVLRMLAEIGSADKVPQFLADVKARKRKLMGFGHRVYKNFGRSLYVGGRRMWSCRAAVHMGLRDGELVMVVQ